MSDDLSTSMPPRRRLPFSGMGLFAILAGALIVCIGMGTRFSFGLFLQPVSVDLGIGREAFGFAIALQNIVWGLSQPFAGAIADRYGPGRVIAIGGTFYGAGLFFAAQSTLPGELYLSLGLLIGLGLSGTTFAVVLGAIGRLVPENRRSLALGIATTGGSMGQFLFIPIGRTLLAEFGWINSFMLLAIGSCLMVLAAMMLARKSGDEASGQDARQSIREAIKEARGHSGYWYLTAAFMVCGFHVTFIGTHLAAFLSDQGLSATIGATALGIIGLFNILSSILAGVLGDIFRKKYLLSWFYLARSLVITGFLIIPITETTALIFAALIGTLWLGTVPITSSLVAQIFGVRYLSMLFGFVFFSHQIGSFFGAWFGGYIYDAYGSYQIAWVIAIAIGILAALLHLPIVDTPMARLRRA